MAEDDGEGVAKAHRRVSPALEKAFQFVVWLVPVLEKFPRSQKFLLADRMQAAALDLLETLIEATYTRDSRPLLRQANLLLERLRILGRLAKELKLLDLRRYEFLARTADEIGRLVGGWMRTGAGEERPA